MSICSPNYLHDAHIRMALRNGAHAICEKPIVLNPWNVDALSAIESETGRRVHTILQLRHHPAIISLRDRHSAAGGGVADVEVTYVTSRGKWYHRSWKGNVEKQDIRIEMTDEAELSSFSAWSISIYRDRNP
jgi:UDP-N-acetyl-2-amino-2-deoxyglucuronate dehydrogenase